MRNIIKKERIFKEVLEDMKHVVILVDFFETFKQGLSDAIVQKGSKDNFEKLVIKDLETSHILDVFAFARKKLSEQEIKEIKECTIQILEEEAVVEASEDPLMIAVVGKSVSRGRRAKETKAQKRKEVIKFIEAKRRKKWDNEVKKIG